MLPAQLGDTCGALYWPVMGLKARLLAVPGIVQDCTGEVPPACPYACAKTWLDGTRPERSF
jgi:hypothetical protein